MVTGHTSSVSSLADVKIEDVSGAGAEIIQLETILLFTQMVMGSEFFVSMEMMVALIKNVLESIVRQMGHMRMVINQVVLLSIPLLAEHKLRQKDFV